MSNHHDHINHALLVKYLLEQADAMEHAQAEAWINASPENQAYFNQLKQAWQQSRQPSSIPSPDENQAWQRFRHRVQSPKPTPRPAAKRYIPLRMAASVITLIGLAWLAYALFTNTGNINTITLYSKDSVTSSSLPDGSQITANKGTYLSYPEKFTGHTRTVKLTGEAFFNVRRDLSRPFRVQADDVLITVTGTSFNVRNEKGAIEVIVETGSVQVSLFDQSVILGPREKAIARASDSTITKEFEQEKLHNYYRTKVFVCDNTPLWKLVAALNSAYDANITIADDELRMIPLTTTFENESLDRILDIIRLTLNVSITKKGEQIIIE